MNASSYKVSPFSLWLIIRAQINRIYFEVMCKNYWGMARNQNNEFLPLVSCQFKSHHVWSPLTDYCPMVTRTSLSCLSHANHLSRVYTQTNYELLQFWDNVVRWSLLSKITQKIYTTFVLGLINRHISKH